jgi:RNA polymerase sigma-70 factor (ECF subfamily)
MERHERVALLQRGLREIESRHRKILLLREFDEMSYQEISEVMEIPLGTVRSRISRARDRLREELVTLDEGVGSASRKPASKYEESEPVECLS